ncbi:hypothetical protein ACFWA1_35895 [Streptomyces sp. NPDC060005]|uniref:hypothetical protein n=1 Tax=Streptomyces sp. NPDC060005 TaxID=3347034 RepID=UPI0036953E8B
MSEAHAAEQLAELHGPDRNTYYGTYVRDWIALCDELRDPDVRGYLILRSLVYDGKGVTNRVRVLTLAQLCKLIPGPNGKPSSLSRIRELLKHLSAVGLVTTPEGGPVTTSSGGKAQGRPLRIKIHDQPANGFKPRWPNTEEKLDSIRPEAERAACEAAERDASRAAAKTTAEKPGRNSDHGGTGWNSDQAGSNSDQAGQNSNPNSRDDLGERGLQSFPSFPASSTTGIGGSAGGQGAGGFARAGGSSGAAPKADSEQDGSAVDLKNHPAPKQRRTHRVTKVTTARPVAGEDAVWEILEPILAELGNHRAGSRPPTLRKAVRLLLGHNTDARSTAFDGHPRKPSHALARLNRGWYGAQGPERSAKGYTGADAIRRPVAYLAAILNGQECGRPECELGTLLTTEEECLMCDSRAVARKAAEVKTRLEAETAELAAGRRARAAAGTPEGHQDHDSADSAVYGVPRQATTWRCEGPNCGRAGRGTPPEHLRCDECEEDLRLSLRAIAPF